MIRFRLGNAMRLLFVVVLTTFQLLAPLRVAADEPSEIPDRYMTLGLEAVTWIYDAPTDALGGAK